MYVSKRNTTSGVVPIGSNLFGTCSTASSTVNKVVTLSDFNVLTEGVTIHVYFTNKNTATQPMLQVGSTTAQAIRYNGSLAGQWESGSVISFTYYNGEWVQNDIQDANNVSYGLSLSGNTLSIVENGGSSSVEISTSDTTYTLSISGHTITLTPSSGTAQSVTVPDNNTTYSISISGNVITLTGSDGSTSTVTVPTASVTMTGSGTGTIQGHSYYYENYSNGTKKRWITVTGTTAITDAQAGGYISEMKSLSISDLGFTTIHNIQATFYYGYAGGSMHIYSYDTSGIQWYFWSAQAVTTRNYTVFLEIVGA